MKKKKEKNVDELFAELYVSTLNYVRKNTISTIKFYENKCNRVRREIIIHKEYEPLKIFKKSHLKWEEKLKKLQEEYDNTFDNFLNECKEFENIFDIDSSS